MQSYNHTIYPGLCKGSDRYVNQNMAKRIYNKKKRFKELVKPDYHFLAYRAPVPGILYF